MTYKEKLLDPRWQKKRLEIFERDKWKCVNCGDDVDTLHIHHLEYKYNTDPWDYDNCTLVTLCAFCHSEIRNIDSSFLKMMRDLGYDDFDIMSLKLFFETVRSPNTKEIIQSMWNHMIEISDEANKK